MQPSWNLLNTEIPIWTCEYLVPNFKSRSYILPLKNKELLIISPGAKLVDTLPKEILEKGNPAIILAPNSFHHYGIPAWRKKYPNIIVVASPQAIPRLNRLGYQEIKPLNLLQEKLPESISLLEPQGLRCGEIWLKIFGKKETGWIIADAFFNMPRLSHHLIARLTQKIVQAAPGLKVSSIVKWFLVKNRAAYKKWILDQLQKDEPTILMPLHGEVIFDKNLKSRLEELIRQRF